MFCWHIVVGKGVESKGPIGRPERSLILLQILVSLRFFSGEKGKRKANGDGEEKIKKFTSQKAEKFLLT